MLLVFIPHIIWIAGIFYVLYKDNIYNERKILYLLLLNFFFILTSIGSNQDEVLEIVNTIAEIMMIGVIAFWMNKNHIFLWDTKSSEDMESSNKNERLQKKNILYGFIGLMICIVIICALLILIEF